MLSRRCAGLRHSKRLWKRIEPDTGIHERRMLCWIQAGRLGRALAMIDETLLDLLEIGTIDAVPPCRVDSHTLYTNTRTVLWHGQGSAEPYGQSGLFCWPQPVPLSTRNIVKAGLQQLSPTDSIVEAFKRYMSVTEYKRFAPFDWNYHCTAVLFCRH